MGVHGLSMGCTVSLFFCPQHLLTVGVEPWFLGLCLAAGVGHLGQYLIEFGPFWEARRTWEATLEPFWTKVANNPAPKMPNREKCHPWGTLFEPIWVHFRLWTRSGRPRLAFRQDFCSMWPPTGFDFTF